MCDVSLEDRLLNAISDLEADGDECEAAAVRELWAERDRLHTIAEDALPLPVLNALQSAIGEYERAVLSRGLAPLDTVKRLYQAARAVIDPEGRVKFGEVTSSVEAERDHLRRALEWLGGHVGDRTNKDCPPECPPEPYNDEDPTPEFPQEKAPEGTVCWDVALECVRCWCRAALAATKEAPDEHADA